MIYPSYDKIQAVYKKKGFRFFENGDYNVNIFGIRTSEIFTNKFDDIIGLAYKFENTKHTLIIPGTTKPGLFGDGAVLNPRPEGVAIIIPGYYRSVWKFIDDYSTWLNYPFFYQIGKFKIWRDNNKDTILDHINEKDAPSNGLNLHRMSWNNISGQYVNNWSEGCQGAEEPEFKKLLPIIRKSVKVYGQVFSYALFNISDFS